MGKEDLKPPENRDSENTVGDETDDIDLNEEQQKAFESILSQIEGGGAVKTEPEAETPQLETVGQEDEDNFSAEIEMIVPRVSAVKESTSDAEGKEIGQPAEPLDEPSDEKTEDITEDIEDLLKTIASEEKFSEEDTGASDSTNKSDKAITAVRKETNPQKGRRWGAIVASMAVLIFLCVSAGLYWLRLQPIRVVVSQPEPKASTIDKDEQTNIVSRTQEPVIVDYGHDDVLRLQTTIDSIDGLRAEMIAKQKEIEELRAYYQAGIDVEIQGIVDTVRGAEIKQVTFKTAAANSRIRLGLNAIQRRDTYIKRLHAPMHRLLLNGEELLFLSRKAQVLSAMAGKTSDLDIDGFIENSTDICNRCKSELVSLNIDAQSVAPVSLESIWKDVAQHLKQKTVHATKNEQGTQTENKAIWTDICKGDFSEKDKLTALSPEVARCLAKWEGKDLYLNRLILLSPEAAHYLSGWKGEWLALNGLVELPPEVASHLANWKGKVLSLNGLSHLSPRVVDILSGWQGDQIELINLEHMAHWDNQKTRLFLSEKFQHQQLATRE